MAPKSKSPALKGTAGLLVIALLWLARQLGWVDGEEKPSGAAQDPAGAGAPSEIPAGDQRREPGSTPSPEADPEPSTPRDSSQTLPAQDGAAEIARLFKYQRSDVQVQGFGRVRATLPDDNDAPRHQKFILEMSNGMTLLVAHNIDLAPRVPLDRGDTIHFNAEYEFSDQGGVLHWTHHDPAKRHEGGWLELDGKRYE